MVEPTLRTAEAPRFGQEIFCGVDSICEVCELKGDVSAGALMSARDQRWIALDQVRALAAFLVFTWHFTHGTSGTPATFDGAPSLPFAALFDEGHVGVSLFMCLSGYLFARLLHGKSIIFGAFFVARAIRLFPLLFVVFAIKVAVAVAQGEPLSPWAQTFIAGWVFPHWPNGGWSIAVELHFYLILPFLLLAQRRHHAALLALLAFAVMVRAIIFSATGEVQTLAYWTIFGRIDQFILGLLAFQYRALLAGKSAVPAACAVIIALVYYAFDLAGGFYHLSPSISGVWIVLPTTEGLAFAALIAWYDSTFSPRGPVAEFIARIGYYSYGIYLLHFFVVFRLAEAINAHVLPLTNFYVAWVAAVPSFLLMLFPAALAYHFFERPFQRIKPRYIQGPRRNSGVFIRS